MSPSMGIFVLLRVVVAKVFLACSVVGRRVQTNGHGTQISKTANLVQLQELARNLIALRPLAFSAAHYVMPQRSSRMFAKGIKAVSAPHYVMPQRNSRMFAKGIKEGSKKKSQKRKVQKKKTVASGKGFGKRVDKRKPTAPEDLLASLAPEGLALKDKRIEDDSQTSNPLLELAMDATISPRLESLNHTHVVSAMPTIVKNTTEAFRNFETRLSSLPSSFEEIIGMRDRILIPWQQSELIRSHLANVKDRVNWRSDIEGEDSLRHEISNSRPWYDALKKLRSQNLTELQSRVVEAQLRKMRLAGVDLDEPAISELNNVIRKLEYALYRYNRNQETSAVILTDPSSVAGMPLSALKAAAERYALGRINRMVNVAHGPWSFGHLSEIAYLPSSALREKLYRGFYQDIDESTSTNCDVIPEILRMRHQRAKLLGFSSHGELQLGERMATSVEEIDKFLAMLFEKAWPAAEAELAELQEFAIANGFKGELQEWDVQHWASRFTDKMWGFDMESTRPYFAFPKLLDGLIELARTLFGIEIRRQDSVAEVWHQDVMFFEAFDEATQDMIGSFYVDPFYRPEDKRPGNYVSILRRRSRELGIKPLACLVTEIDPPRGDAPALMTWREAKLLFHEFGHLLHHLLAPDSEGTEWDMLEFPSKFMENFFFQGIEQFATHYETGEPLSPDIVQKLKESRKFMAGTYFLELLEKSAVDMEWHARYSPEKYQTYQDVLTVQRNVSKKYQTGPVIMKQQFGAGNHLFCHGYDAGFYSYLWSEVASVDAFAAFEEVGFNDTIALGTKGRHFRHTVLEGLGNRDPSKLYRDFRGRNVAVDALLRQYGLM